MCEVHKTTEETGRQIDVDRFDNYILECAPHLGEGTYILTEWTENIIYEALNERWVVGRMGILSHRGEKDNSSHGLSENLMRKNKEIGLLHYDNIINRRNLK